MYIHDGHIHVSSDGAHRAAEAARNGGAKSWSVLSLGQYNDDPAQNLSMLLCKAYAPEQCFAFCSLDHPGTDYLGQLKMWLDAGFDGLKLIESKPDCAKRTGVRLDDEAFEPMFAFCEENRVPILWHNGDPAECWDPSLCPPGFAENGWAYCDGTYPSLTELYAAVERVLDRHPMLNVTFAHFYFVSDDPAHAARMFEKYPNVHFDITPGTEMYDNFTKNREFFRPFFVENAHRIQYGTDADVSFDGAPDWTHLIWEGVQKFLTTGESFEFFGYPVHGYALPIPVQEQIFSGTFRSFAGDRPKSISRKAAEAACEYMRSAAPGQQTEDLAHKLLSLI